MNRHMQRVARIVVWRVVVWWVLALAVPVHFACEPDPSEAEKVDASPSTECGDYTTDGVVIAEATIGPAGGALAAEGLTVTVPPRALTRSCRLAIARGTPSMPLPEGVEGASAAYEILPHGLSFDEVLAVQLPHHLEGPGRSVHQLLTATEHWFRRDGVLFGEGTATFGLWDADAFMATVVRPDDVDLEGRWSASSVDASADIEVTWTFDDAAVTWERKQSFTAGAVTGCVQRDGKRGTMSQVADDVVIDWRTQFNESTGCNDPTFDLAYQEFDTSAADETLAVRRSGTRLVLDPHLNVLTRRGSGTGLDGTFCRMVLSDHVVGIESKSFDSSQGRATRRQVSRYGADFAVDPTFRGCVETTTYDGGYTVDATTFTYVPTSQSFEIADCSDPHANRALATAGPAGIPQGGASYSYVTTADTLMLVSAAGGLYTYLGPP